MSKEQDQKDLMMITAFCFLFLVLGILAGTMINTAMMLPRIEDKNNQIETLGQAICEESGYMDFVSYDGESLECVRKEVINFEYGNIKVVGGTK